jgi:hypothetical protein
MPGWHHLLSNHNELICQSYCTSESWLLHNLSSGASSRGHGACDCPDCPDCPDGRRPAALPLILGTQTSTRKDNPGTYLSNMTPFLLNCL